MLNLNCKIKVYETNKDLERTGTVYEFDYAYAIEIESSVKNFTDTAVVKIPKKIIVNQLNSRLGFEITKQLPFDIETQSIYHYLGQDNAIEIFLGYNGELKPAFRGFITEVKGDAPVCVYCEDEMYRLKKDKMEADTTANPFSELQNPIVSGASRTLKGIEIKTQLETRLKALSIAHEIYMEDTLGSLIVNRKTSIAKFLKKLREDYGIFSFFKLQNEKNVLIITNNPHLYDTKDVSEAINANDNTETISSQLAVVPQNLLRTAVNTLGIQDVIDFFRRDDGFLGEARFRFFYNIISDNLKLDEQEIKKIRMRAEKYFVNSNTSIFEETGDPMDGDLIQTFTMHDNENELPKDNVLYRKKALEVRAELKTFLNLRFLERKKDGLKGSFTTFGEPFVRPTDRVILEDAEDAEKNGTFQVEAVKRSFGVGGYRQEISVGRKVS